ncbi:hypothetical protein [Marinisporobacter balticus]|uniref:Uncharacterized protein n=1 Tax=Marinisporobacter balticus TaxID=2018667 RepID=A0A4R2KQI4_9FIRM|nr:hypothetical protein [Marinisporobacter balticus]TCO74962.1 hypothetical protein EV214_11033 [Marinisporobacter balticus]
MRTLSQEYLLDIAFNLAIDQEELLLEKYRDYDHDLDNKELKTMMKELKITSKEHIKLMKDLMIKLNIQG